MYRNPNFRDSNSRENIFDIQNLDINKLSILDNALTKANYVKYNYNKIGFFFDNGVLLLHLVKRSSEDGVYVIGISFDDVNLGELVLSKQPIEDFGILQHLKYLTDLDRDKEII